MPFDPRFGPIGRTTDEWNTMVAGRGKGPPRISNRFKYLNDLTGGQFSWKMNELGNRLGLKENASRAECVHALVSGLESASYITHLVLRGDLSSTWDFDDLMNHLCHVPGLVYLDLAGNNIGPKKAEVLADRLIEIPLLKTLILAENPLLPEGVRALALGLPDVPMLERLNLENNHLGLEEMRVLKKGLKCLPHLRVLNLSRNRLGLSGVYELLDVLEQLPRLKMLYLSSNHIGEEHDSDVKAQIESKRPHLEHLELRDAHGSMYDLNN